MIILLCALGLSVGGAMQIFQLQLSYSSRQLHTHSIPAVTNALSKKTIRYDTRCYFNVCSKADVYRSLPCTNLL